MLAPEIVQPAYLWVPDHISTAGAEAADLAAELGYTLDAEQRLALDAVLAETKGGRWASLEACLICARQNLKTFVAEIVAIADLWLGFGSRLVVWTAHEFSTAEESRRHVNELIEAHPFLSRRVSKIVEQNGEEGVELIDGKRLRFKARTKSGGRGLTGDRVILDEAFALQPAHMGALMPTMSAKSVTGNPQIIYLSSAGHPDSGVLRGVRDRGRPGGDPSLTYVEWCADRQPCADARCDHHVGSDGCQLDVVENWRAANPALERRISVDFVAAERRSMPPVEFARERLGWWEDPAETDEEEPDELDIAGHWDACVDASSQLESIEAWAVAPARDLSWCAIAVAGRRADGLLHLEVVESLRGTRRVASVLQELREKHGEAPVLLEKTGPRWTGADDLREVGIDPVMVSSEEMVSACGALYDGLLRQTHRHIGQPELDVAVGGVRRRNVGDAWVWSRLRSTVDISPLVAVTLAAWGATQGSTGSEPFMLVT